MTLSKHLPGGSLSPFKAFVIERAAHASRGRGVFREWDESQLDGGDVLIRIKYSSVNYKDAQAGTGRQPVVRRFPCIGGVDLAGIVLKSAAPRFKPGDEVIATGYELGLSHHGGYAEYALVPGGWLLPRPDGLDTMHCMALGSAGLAVAMALSRMEDNGLKPEAGPVVVTGATGGVGSLAVDVLAARGYEVVAVTGKVHLTDWLLGLGASRVVRRDELPLKTAGLMGKARWAGALDSVGGEVLAYLLGSTKPAGNIASIGWVGGAEFASTALPFATRGVSLLGVDSTYAGFAMRERAWARLASDLRPRHFDQIVREVPFEGLPEVFEQLISGTGHGRTVVRIDNGGNHSPTRGSDE